MDKLNWLLSWNAFLDWVGEQYTLKKSDAEIAQAVTDNLVRWNGRVVKLKLDSKYVPGIELDMGSHRIELPDGNQIDQHYLYLLVSDPASWATTKPGDMVDFVGEIQQSDSRDPFLPINLIVDIEQHSVGIRLGIRNGVHIS